MARRPRRTGSAGRARSTDSAARHDRFVGCDKPGDRERAEALADELVKAIARQLAREDHLAEKQKTERKRR
jgi:hypothetical protein